MTWQEISGALPHEVGKTYKSVTKLHHDGLPLNDSKVKADIERISYRELENELYKQTGGQIKIKRHTVTATKSGYDYEDTLEYSVQHTSLTGFLVLSIILGGVIAAILWRLEILVSKVFESVGIPTIPGTEISIIWLVVGLVFFILIMNLLRG